MQFKLLLEDSRIAKLLMPSFDVVSLLNPSFEIIYRSPNAERVTGWTDQERIGGRLGDILHADDAAGVTQSLCDILKVEGLSKTCVFRAISPDTNYVWFEASFTNMLGDPDIGAIVCHYRDISDTRKFSNLLDHTSNELYSYKYALDESALVAVTDQKGIIKYVNENFCRISGYGSSELIGQDHRIINSSYHHKAYIRELWTTIAGGKVWKGEFRNKAKNGSLYWVDTTIVPFLNKKGKPYQYVSIRFDITARKLGEDKLRDEQRHLKLLESVITNTRDAILITEAEPQDEPGPRIIFVNEAFTKMTGYTSAEVIGKTPRILQGPKTDRKELDRLKESLLAWKPCEITVINYKKNGEEFWINLTVTPVADETGIYTHWISVERDITERRELENLLDRVTTLAGIGGWLVDLVRDSVFWSPITSKIHEVGDDFVPEMLSALGFYKNEEDRELIKQKLDLAIQEGIPFDFEAEIVTALGKVRWVRVIGEPEFENNRCVRIRGSFQDIDVRKRAELAARDALEEKNIILESIGDAFFAVDRNWNVTYWNHVAEKVLRKSKQQMEGQNLWEVFSDAVGSYFYNKYMQAVDTNQAVHFEDFYPAYQTWYDISAYPSADGISVYFKDITERKRINSALEESERNYSSLFQLSPLPMWVFDIQTLRFLDVNQAAIESYGYSKEEFLTMTIKDIRPAGDLSLLLQVLEHPIIPHETIRRGIFNHLKKNGDVIQVDIQSNLIQYKGKSAKVIIANDMTQRFTYIKAIEEQNSKLREIAFLQSHVVRAPLARIMGIVPMLQNTDTFADERAQLLEFLRIAANELDDVVRDISGKTGLVAGH